LKLDWNDYPVEPLPIDGSMLHAIERLFSIFAENEGYKVAVTHVPGITR
jgi:lipopolysaccharide biosynthesis protein